MRTTILSYISVFLILSFSIVVALIPIIVLNVNCSHYERADYIIQTQQEWEGLWNNTYHSTYADPEINFNSSVVIAVYMGERATGGYNIEITRILKSEAHRLVIIRETKPSPFGLRTMAPTHPFHIVKLNRNGNIIKLIHIKEDHPPSLLY